MPIAFHRSEDDARAWLTSWQMPHLPQQSTRRQAAALEPETGMSSTTSAGG